MNSNGKDGWTEQILAKINENRRVYLCEYGIVHLKWDENNLVYCPGDFIGLPFLLSSLTHQCSWECERGEPCPNEGEDGMVYLQYHSVKLPFTPDECRQMYDLTVAASRRLHELRYDGLFNAGNKTFFLPG
ncbi:MAG: hypothetical protein HF973_06165 [Chloroflexi bacterium]|nr:hypothetical protein [Chloroflexota bacterium]